MSKSEIDPNKAVSIFYSPSETRWILCYAVEKPDTDVSFEKFADEKPAIARAKELGFTHRLDNEDDSNGPHLL